MEWKIGFEIEKVSDNAKFSTDMMRDYELNLWSVHSDCSLEGDYGCELVSKPMPLDLNIIKEYIFTEEEAAVFIDKSGVNESCGGHISLSCDTLDTIEVFHSIKGYLPLLYAIYKARLDMEYSQRANVYNYTAQKYRAFSFEPHRLEVRIFPGVKSIKQLLWRAELLKIMIDNPTSSQVRGYKNLPLFFELLNRVNINTDGIRKRFQREMDAEYGSLTLASWI